MGIRQNIFISIMIHITVIASVFIIANRIRDTADRVPANYMMVALFKEMTGISSEPSPTLSPPRGRTERVHKKDLALQEPLPGNDNRPFLHDQSEIAEIRSENKKGKMDISINNNADISEVIAFNQTISKNSLEEQSFYRNGRSSGEADMDDLYALIRNAIENAKKYPFLARKRKIEGTVIMEFTIDNKGYPQNIKVRKSSGYEILDSSAIKIVRNAAPLPYVKGEINIPISFRLTDYQTYTYR